MAPDNAGPLPERFADIKKDIAASYPEFQERATKAWAEIIQALGETTASIVEKGSEYIPQVYFKDLKNLDQETVDRIRRVGTVIIRDIVDDAEAAKWKEDLKTFVKENPDVDGFPEPNKQFFELYWTKPQVKARSHPNLLAASTWLNQLYHLKSGAADTTLEGVDLSVPLTYADRFRIRHPGQVWNFHPPHVDGGTIERWEEPNFRKCFSDILEGNWREHDAYDLEGRLNARTSLYGRPSQSTVFRTFQGWLAMSETGPGEGTLKTFPDVLLSNAYIILRPFFRPIGSGDALLDPKNWEFDLSSPEFPGIFPKDGGYGGPHPTPLLHPHLQLQKTMTSMPKVYPGDAVFWHCDVIHEVEGAHDGSDDSAVMYIPAVPKTPMNLAYVARQKECFLDGQRPPDFPKGKGEKGWVGVGAVEDVASQVGRVAMGLQA
ncbi:hypothetical protein D9611_001342 [Ephemerocybe angulata]|uniref:DUF1479-domain-containing protein n=1 Tax=Ephemerocybe angulata TaxID=980116 RepID=A0A8H5FMV1_9AGAR|nr:hypothetical protein D9611_001342 [Tulosesus angulatus]